MLSSVTVHRRLLVKKKAFEQFWDIYKTRRAGLVGLTVLTALCVLAVFPGIFSPYNPRATGPISSFMSPPSSSHLLGTDDAGEDVLSLLIWGHEGR